MSLEHHDGVYVCDLKSCTRVAQMPKLSPVDFSSDPDLRVMKSSPTLLGIEPVWDYLSLSLSFPLPLPSSLKIK